jgi:predicted enzyme related to lactoylglutathione lyase
MDEVEELEYGRFGWFVDPAGVKIELWEPPPASPDDVHGEG